MSLRNILKFSLIAFIVAISFYFLYQYYHKSEVQKIYPKNLEMQNLLLGIRSENFSEIDKAIHQGASLDKQESNTSPLQYAFKYRKLKSFQYLLSKGANPNILFNENRSLILDAIDRNNIDYLKAIVQNKGDINLLHKLGVRPLYYALVNKRNQAVDILIENGADICLADKYHRTVFTELLLGRDFDQALYLLEKNLNPFLSDSNVQISIKYSIERSYKVRSPSPQYKNFGKLVQKLEQLGFKFELKEL